jgi:peroxiredoxin
VRFRRCSPGGMILLGLAISLLSGCQTAGPTESAKIPVGSPLDPNLGVKDGEAAGSLRLRHQKDHPVTTEMARAAESLDAKKAPEFSLPDGDGKNHTLAGLQQGRPALIFFIEKECPCCLGAKFFVDRLAGLHKDTAVVFGLINATGDTAAEWRRATRPQFLVLEDPDQAVISAYAAERGVYTVIVAPDGTINKAYPGYSREAVDDMSRRLSRLAGVKERPYLTQAAPERMTSGCLFPPAPK